MAGRLMFPPINRRSDPVQHFMTPDLEREGGPGKLLPSTDLTGVFPMSLGEPSTIGERDQLGSQLIISGQEKCSPSNQA